MRRVILIILLVILVVGAVFYIRAKKQMAATGVAPSGVFKSFFPLNTTPGTGANTTVPATTDSSASSTTPAAPSRFTQISARAIAGFNAYTDTYTISVPATTPKGKPTTKTMSDNVIRYISRTNGFVYEKRNADLPVQISNIYIPNVYEGAFMDNNQSAVLRFLRDDNQTIATYIVPIPPKNTDNTRTQKDGHFLNDGITAFGISPDSTEFLRIYTLNGNGEVLTSDSADKNKKEVVNSPFSEWLALWPTKTTVYLQTKAAASADGFLYKVDRTERRLRRVLGNIHGLTTLVSPSGTYILYSESMQNSLRTVLYNTITNKTTPLSLKILPEKCTWIQDDNLICAGNTTLASAQYPDSWYAGTTHFSDKLFRISTSTTTYETLYDGNERSFDMTNLEYNQPTSSVYFIDKDSGVLWQYGL